MSCTRYYDFKFGIPCPIYNFSKCVNKEFPITCEVISNRPHVPCLRYLCPESVEVTKILLLRLVHTDRIKHSGIGQFKRMRKRRQLENSLSYCVLRRSDWAWKVLNRPLVILNKYYYFVLKHTVQLN